MTQLDPAFFKPFVDGTLHTLKVSCATTIVPGKPFLKGAHPQPEFDIAGVIGVISESFTGTVTLCFTGPLYLSLLGKMLGEEFKEITGELADGAGELLNMIFGHAKVVLNQQGHTIQKAIPTVIRGRGLQTTHLGKPGVIVLPFSTADGELHIEIGVEGDASVLKTQGSVTNAKK